MSASEFVKFCDETEKELWALFNAIDRDHNGNLDKSELAQAFEKAGVAVSNARLDRFFRYIDKNHDGTIDFPEWRGQSLSLSDPICAGVTHASMSTENNNLLTRTPYCSQTSCYSYRRMPRA
jgi:hypothetical protein